MALAYYISVFFCLACCVSADDWDDFANNLATDLAPLITLFGEQITRQCMSELISTLDDFIFALAPLGVLTAVVSVIRVCGNSTLRAIIGRAQEDPASSEKEILSCVSDSTAEIFTESGVARITGNPKILEIVADESQAQSGVVTIRRVSEVAGKAWTDLEKDAKLPNLSLNKGIRRRAPFWFHLAATFGVALQLSIIIYAALTVMYWPQAFLKNGGPVDSYAFPMFVLGTTLLTLGMFLCAVLIERHSKKHIFTLPEENRVYWIQPGNQTVGDQKFPSFVGRTDKGVYFIRSVRDQSPNDVLNVGRGMELMFVVCLTMTGFVIQFVGIRGLHSSVILAQLGATMVMTLVRTGLRAERMQEGDNMLKDDQNIVSSGEHELDWLTYHLLNVKSFRVLSTASVQGLRMQPDPVNREPIMMREKLRKLAGEDWDETRARRMAQNLKRAALQLMHLIPRWSDKEVSYFDIIIPIQIQKNGDLQAIAYGWETRLTIAKGVDVDFWEAIIGLYVWFLKQRNNELYNKPSLQLLRAFNPKSKSTHQARLLYRVWTNDKSVVELKHPYSIAFFEGCETFGSLRSQSGSQIADQPAVATVSSDCYSLAAQDIYSHILHSMLEGLPMLGGETRLVGHDKETYKMHNDRIDRLVDIFTSAGLGDQTEAMVCILPVLSDRGLLPEITYDSAIIRRHMHELEKLDNNEIFPVSEWLCCLADHGEVEHVLVDYGYICLRNLMDRNDMAKSLALERIVAILKADGCEISTFFTGTASAPEENWLKSYRSELHWIATRILQFYPIGNHFPRAKLILHEFEKLLPTKYELNEVYGDEQAATSAQSILLNSWFELDFGELLSDEHTRMLLDWLSKNRYDNILQWFVIRMIAELSPNYSHDNIKKLLSYATSNGYQAAVETMWRHINRFHIQVSIIEELASDGDVRTLENTLGRDFSGQSAKEHEIALLKAVERKQYAVIEYLLAGGVNVDAQNLSGETALIISAKKYDIKSASFLVSQGASLEKRDDSGDTALIVAAASGHSSIVDLLIKNGADINATGYRGRTALMAATLGQNLPLIKYLCEQKADIHILSVDQMSVLDVAARGDMSGPWIEGCDFFESIGAQRYVGRKYEEF